MNGNCYEFSISFFLISTEQTKVFISENMINIPEKWRKEEMR